MFAAVLKDMQVRNHLTPVLLDTYERCILAQQTFEPDYRVEDAYQHVYETNGGCPWCQRQIRSS